MQRRCRQADRRGPKAPDLGLSDAVEARRAAVLPFSEAVAEAAACPITIPGLAATQAAIWRRLGAGDLDRATGRLRGLAADLAAAIAQAGPPEPCG